MKNLEKLLKRQQQPVNVIYVSSYIPRRCGIATYTKDLTNAINLLNSRSLAEIMTVARAEEQIDYPWESKFKIVYNDLGSYLAAAAYANQSYADLVLLEHEFGLYGGAAGEYILHFAEALKIPLVTTFHTVIDDPSSHQADIAKRIAKKSEAIIVMMENVAERLVKSYGIPRRKIVVIPHGVPDFPFNASEVYKKQRKLSDRFVLGNINLLDPNKGIEYALEAVALIAKKYPSVLYMIIGETHPVLKAREGEAYRNFLKKRIKELGITDNVKFINKYLPLSDVIAWLKTIDIYVTPYLEPGQITSGALAYAIGAGKACVSTPYIYSQEVLADGRGILVPFRDGPAIAEAALRLWEDPEFKRTTEQKAYEFGRLMTWPNVAQSHVSLFRAVLDRLERKKQQVTSPGSAHTPEHTPPSSARP